MLVIIGYLTNTITWIFFKTSVMPIDIVAHMVPFGSIALPLIQFLIKPWRNE